MKRIGTGIEKLDDILGGVPEGRAVLVTGDAGSGKTIFSLQFADRCCTSGKKVLYVATEENADDLRMQARSFGWDLVGYEKDGCMRFAELVSRRMADVRSAIEISIESMKGSFEPLLEPLEEDTDVLIIDSLGSHTGSLSAKEFKDRLDLLIHRLRKMGVTCLLVLDSATSKQHNDLALFSVYGAIALLRRENPYTGKKERVMDVIKMRSTKTPVQLLPFEMFDGGIRISKGDTDMDRI